MNNIKTFENTEFGSLEVVLIEGKPYFPATECATILGYTNPQKAVRDHCPHRTNRSVGVQTGVKADGSPAMQTVQRSFIPEGDLYRLIIRSKLPAAERFERWVFDEVLPSIRQTGGYVSNEDLFLNTYLPNADEATRAMFRSTLETVRKLNAQIEENKPKVLFADAVAASHTSILIGDLAKLLRQNGVQMGQNRLFDWMRQNGYLHSSGARRNMPTQRSMENGWFEVKESTIGNPDGSVRVVRTTKVSGKGQTYFINCFMGGAQ